MNRDTMTLLVAGLLACAALCPFKRACGQSANAHSSSFAGSEAGETRSLVQDPKIEFCWCPAGKYQASRPTSEFDVMSKERQAEVTLTRGFWLARTEITQGQWKTVMKTEPWRENGRPQQPTYSTREGAEYPAVYLEWDDAVAFCAKLTEVEHRAGRLPTEWEYSLPTEAQWEYACRAGTTTRFSFGDDPVQLREHAWFRGNALDVNELYAHAVRTKAPNPWGLFDMHGNVHEFCKDVMTTTSLLGGIDPIQDSNPIKSARGFPFHVIRGGSWNDSPAGVRSGSQTWTFMVGDNIGIRVACVESGRAGS